MTRQKSYDRIKSVEEKPQGRKDNIMSMLTLKIEQQDGSIKDVEVSEDFMDLCKMRANHIVKSLDIHHDKVGKIRELVEECTTDDNMRSVIGTMVMRKLSNQVMISLLGRALDDLLGK